MEQETLTQFPPDFSDLDHSFTSSSSSYATTFASSSSARSSLSLPSFKLSSSASLLPHPHRSSDPHWSAIRAATNLSSDGTLHLRHLKLLRHLGSGNLARVFHCRLRGFEDQPEASGSADFALKVIDLDAIARADGKEDVKLSHVRTEARVLSSLDHPFLPTLYARLDVSHYTCFLIDYCPGGDLHSLLRRQPRHRFSAAAVRFFAAEVLLALEYLHAQGYVYRDLKPENVLLRGDGHVMLSDFDLCFQADVVPTLHKKNVGVGPARRRRRRSNGCCFGGALGGDEEEVTEFAAEPETAFSRECVGTHEYLAPEVVNGNGHGNGVDWWAFGVFVYELLYGRTPFKGGNKEGTLRNIATKELRFPEEGGVVVDDDVAAARDLIGRLLVRDPRRRLGSTRGAAEIKRHAFFEGIRWPLIRCYKPPVVVGGAVRVTKEKRRWWHWKSNSSSKGIKLGFGSKNKKTNDKGGRWVV